MLLALGTFAGATEGNVIASLLPAIASDTGVSVADAGYVVFGYSLAYGIGTPVLSAVFGAVDRRWLLTFAELAFAVGALLVALAPTFLTVVIARIGMSFGAGLYTAMALGTAMSLVPPERRGRAVSVVVAGQTLAAAIGAPAGAWLAHVYGWRSTYVAIAVLALIATATIWLMLPKGIVGERQTLRERVGVIAIPGVPMALLITAVLMLGTYMVVVYLAPVTTDAMGLDPGLMPLVLLAYGLGSMLGNPIAGQLSDRLGSRGTLVVFIAALVLALLLLWPITRLPLWLRLPAYFGYMALLGLICWGFFTAMLSRLGALAPSAAPLAVSLNSTAINLGVAVAAVLGGVALTRFGTEFIGIAAVPFVLAALGLALLAMRRRAT